MTGGGLRGSLLRLGEETCVGQREGEVGLCESESLHPSTQARLVCSGTEQADRIGEIASEADLGPTEQEERGGIVVVWPAPGERFACAIGGCGLCRSVGCEEEDGEAHEEVVFRDAQTLATQERRAVRVAEEVAATGADEQQMRVVRLGLGEAELLELAGAGFEDEAEPVPAQGRTGEFRIAGGEALADGIDHGSTISAS